PFYFSWAYAAIKPILPTAVIRKVRIYGTDGWKETLLKEINSDDLPAYLGGKRTDPEGNPLCESFSVSDLFHGLNFFIPRLLFTSSPFKTPFLGGYDMNWTLPAWVVIYLPPHPCCNLSLSRTEMGCGGQE
ncbi:hypothetical protein AVEN_77435-1, partial [Araneus ventricosus]